MKTNVVPFVSLRFSALLILSVLCFLVGGEAHAADYDIYVTEDGFDPAYLEVQAGDTVNWWNDDSFGDNHTCRSYAYSWNSGLIPWLAPPFTITVTRVGSWDYIDEITAATGTLVVHDQTSLTPTPILLNPAHLANGSFQCTISNLVAGKTSIVEASTNLVNWAPISTNIAPDTSYLYTDNAAASLSRRFYRAVALP